MPRAALWPGSRALFRAFPSFRPPSAVFSVGMSGVFEVLSSSGFARFGGFVRLSPFVPSLAIRIGFVALRLALALCGTLRGSGF